MPSIQQVILLSALAIILNVPLGWWRASVPKYSLAWFVAIHLSVPVIYFFRTWAGISGSYIVLLIIAFAIIGQIIGGRLHAAD